MPLDAVKGGPAYQPLVSASSGLPVALVSLTPAVCAIQGNEVAPQAAGLCTIAAEQGGDAEYEAASPATQSYAVAAAAPAAVSPGSGVPTGGTPGGEVLSLPETSTPFPATETLDLQATGAISRRDGTITLLLGVRPGGTVRWKVTFTRTTRCPAHARSCADQVVRFAAGSRVVPAGGLTLTLHPSAAALRLLRDRRTLHVHALVTLTTTSGTLARVRATLVVRLASPR